MPATAPRAARPSAQSSVRQTSNPPRNVPGRSRARTQHLIGVIPDSAPHTLPRSKTARQLVDARKSTGTLPSRGVAFQRVMWGDILRSLPTLTTNIESPHPAPRPGSRVVRGCSPRRADHEWVIPHGKRPDDHSGCGARDTAGQHIRLAPYAARQYSEVERRARLGLQPCATPWMSVTPSAEDEPLVVDLIAVTSTTTTSSTVFDA